MKSLIKIGNDGEFITETNFYDSEIARKGYSYLSFNAGAARLLVPDSQIDTIKEMKTGEHVVILRRHIEKFKGREFYSLLFDDKTETPYNIDMCVEQSDRLLPKSDHKSRLNLHVYTRKGLEFSLPAVYNYGIDI